MWICIYIRQWSSANGPQSIFKIVTAKVGLFGKSFHFQLPAKASQHTTGRFSHVPEAFCIFPHSHYTFSHVSLHIQELRSENPVISELTWSFCCIIQASCCDCFVVLVYGNLFHINFIGIVLNFSLFSDRLILLVIVKHRLVCDNCDKCKWTSHDTDQKLRSRTVSGSCRK